MDLVWHPRVVSMLYHKHRWICLFLSTKSDFSKWHSHKLSGFHWLWLNWDWCRQLGNKQKQTGSSRIFSSEHLKSCSLSEGVVCARRAQGTWGFIGWKRGTLVMDESICRSVPLQSQSGRYQQVQYVNLLIRGFHRSRESSQRPCPELLRPPAALRSLTVLLHLSENSHFPW